MDGSYLCTAGQEPTVYVWAVTGASTDTAADASSGSGSGSSSTDEAPIFASEPIRSYKGHKADVIDVAWYKLLKVQAHPPASLTECKSLASSQLRTPLFLLP